MKQEEIDRIVDAVCDEYERTLDNENPRQVPQLVNDAPPAVRLPLLNELLALEKELLEPRLVVSNLKYYSEALPKFSDLLQRQIGNQENEIGAAASDGASRRIGNYKLLQEIGTGGMGSVWMAEQQQPVRRRVALKIIKKGLHSKEVVARFEAERQAVAMMDHPNIAKILDAGTTEDGQPFFAMELVQGSPLTEYCDVHQLSIDQRLDVFRQVCDGVQHAHQKGILHRDLKPSNVLVAEYGGQAVPKIIDFGLAKALDLTTQLTDKTMFTEFGQVIGTIKYMSPEQAGLDSLDIDTRSDIYALGIILYELLTGSTPLDETSIQGQALLKMLELVRDIESPKPSSRLLTTRKESLATITAHRKTNTKKLGQILSGDLDWIVMKAVEKDRNRRYKTAIGFADDIQRYRNNEPVLACPPTAAYRLKKFVQKNQGLVASLSAISVALIAGIIGTTVFAFDSSAARKRAEKAMKVAQANEKKATDSQQQTRDAINDFYTTVSEEELLETPGLQPLRKKLLEKASRYYEVLSNESLGRGSGLMVANNKSRFAVMTRKLGDVTRAIELLQEALAIAEEDTTEGQEDKKRLFKIDNLGRLASYYRLERNLQKGRDSINHALSLAKTAFDENPTEAIRMLLSETLISAARISRQEGRSTQQFKEADEARQLLQKRAEENLTSSAAEIYGEALNLLMDVVPKDKAAKYQDKVIELGRAMREDDPTRLFNIETLAAALTNKASHLPYQLHDQAFDLFVEAEGYWKELHQQSPAVDSYRFGLANNLDKHAFTKHQSGKNADSETKRDYFIESLEMYDRAAQLLRVRYSKDNPPKIDVSRAAPAHYGLLGMVLNGQALVNRDMGRQADSVLHFQAAIELQKKIVAKAPDSFGPQMDLAGSMLNLGLTLAKFEDYQSAISYHRKAVDAVERLITKFPDQNGLYVYRINFSMALNDSLFVSGDIETAKQDFIDVRPYFETAESKTGNNLFAVKSLAEQQIALRSILEGETESFGKFMKSQFNSFGIQRPQTLIQGAAVLAAIHHATQESELLTEPDRKKMVEWGKTYLDRVIKRGISVEELKKEKLFQHLLSQ